MSTTAAPRSRAAALPAEERRAALIEATLPLLLEHGAAVTTRQIAEAAGVAEGTIFRVFPDKEHLLQAVVERAFDPAPIEAGLRAIDPALPRDQRLVVAVELLQQRVTRIWQVMTAVGMAKPPEDRLASARTRAVPELEALAALFEPDRDQFRRSPLECARLLRGLTFACSHPALVADDPASAAEIVSLLLDGVRLTHPDPTPSPET
jgi:AcrR family transcriptional regulator